MRSGGVSHRSCRCPRAGSQLVVARRHATAVMSWTLSATWSTTGASGRALPADFPPWRTVYGFFTRWHRVGVLTRIRDALLRAVRLAAGYCPLPVAVVIDSQTVRAAETVARSSRGYDTAKRINGRKRSVAVDLSGLLVATMVTGAGVQDRDIVRDLLARPRIEHPRVPIVWAGGDYRGELVPWAAERLRFRIETVTQPAGTRGFVVLPRRWVVERSLVWLSHARRTVRDYERLPEHSEALITWAAVTLMTTAVRLRSAYRSHLTHNLRLFLITTLINECSLR
jgi:transposase